MSPNDAPPPPSASTLAKIKSTGTGGVLSHIIKEDSALVKKTKRQSELPSRPDLFVTEPTE